MVTEYGTIPYVYADASAYPFAVFSGRVFVRATDSWSDMLTAMNGKLNADENKAQVILRRDFSITDPSFSNLSQLCGFATIDLGGYIVSVEKGTFLVANKKTAENSEICVKNGKIVLKNAAKLLEFSSGNANGSGKKFDISFESVDVSYADGATQKNIINTFASVSVNTIVSSEVVFTNCNIDLKTNAPSGTITFMNLGNDANNHSATVTFNGGSISVGSSFVLASIDSNDTSALDRVMFSNEYGRYTKIVTALGGVAPNFEYITDGNKDANAVKWNDNSVLGTTTYIIREETLVTFTPKSSITLSNALIYNVYIPVSDALESFTLDGVTYTDLAALTNVVTLSSDGKQYYHFKIELPSPKAARDIVLLATVTVGDSDYSGSWTMSIPKYAKKVIEESTKDYEKKLAKDVLAYVAAAYEYFTDENDAAEITRVVNLINEILVIGGDYEGIPESSGETKINENSCVSDVTLNLDAKPTIRFYVSGTTVKFYRDAKHTEELNTVSGTADGKSYVELDVYAYALSETIYFGDGESYHISKFLAGSVEQPHENLVACFIVYLESAAAYRESVIGGDN